MSRVIDRRARFAYADPPYIGQARKHYAREAAADGRVATEVDHPELIERLVDEYPDGWTLSCTSNSLRILLPLCPDGTRVMAWTKNFAMPKNNVYPMYAWEPVLLCGGRRLPPTSGAPDWHMASRANTRPDQTLTAKGAKPLTFCLWLLRCLGYQPGDVLDDLFPGSGIMAEAVAMWGRQPDLPLEGAA